MYIYIEICHTDVYIFSLQKYALTGDAGEYYKVRMKFTLVQNLLLAIQLQFHLLVLACYSLKP